jgi:hypothetical protein
MTLRFLSKPHGEGKKRKRIAITRSKFITNPLSHPCLSPLPFAHLQLSPLRHGASQTTTQEDYPHIFQSSSLAAQWLLRWLSTLAQPICLQRSHQPTLSLCIQQQPAAAHAPSTVEHNSPRHWTSLCLWRQESHRRNRRPPLHELPSLRRPEDGKTLPGCRCPICIPPTGVHSGYNSQGVFHPAQARQRKRGRHLPHRWPRHLLHRCGCGQSWGIVIPSPWQRRVRRSGCQEDGCRQEAHLLSARPLKCQHHPICH